MFYVLYGLTMALLFIGGCKLTDYPISSHFCFLAALGLHCCEGFFSSCGEQGRLFIAGLRLLIAVASLVAEHRL